MPVQGLYSMRLHSPSMSELHAFATAARLGSFSRAAAELCVTQSAVSHQLRHLEEMWGLQLFQRGKSLTLTPAGGAEIAVAGGKLLHLRRIGRVQYACRGLRAAVFPGDGQRLFVDITNRNPGTQPGERAGNRPANALSGAGHEDRLGGKIEFHLILLHVSPKGLQECCGSP